MGRAKGMTSEIGSVVEQYTKAGPGPSQHHRWRGARAVEKRQGAKNGDSHLGDYWQGGGGGGGGGL